MKVDLQFPWERYAVITELADQLSDRQTGLFGKTALQKFVYFLQELEEVDCGYEFTLYTYGPFSSELLGDLDIVEVMDGVDIEYIPQVNGYDIHPGRKAGWIRARADRFLEGARPRIERLVESFGELRARDLELRATIVYCDRDARRRGEAVSEASLAKVVRSIKPHFSEHEIRSAVRELEEQRYVLAA